MRELPRASHSLGNSGSREGGTGEGRGAGQKAAWLAEGGLLEVRKEVFFTLRGVLGLLSMARADIS